jgi:hypothetical protein
MFRPGRKPGPVIRAQPIPATQAAPATPPPDRGRVARQHELVRLKAEDMHAGNRLALYRAKMYGHPSRTADGDSRLRELERIREGTARRLRQALDADAAARRTPRVPSGDA